MITAAKKRGRHNFGIYGDIAVVVLLISGLALVYLCYLASFLGTISQFILAIIFLVLVGLTITWIKSLNGAYGLYMIGGKHGINFIEKLSGRAARFWEAMALWGVVLGFGLLAYPLLKGRISKKLYAFGMISLFAFFYFIIPYLVYPVQLITLPQIQALVSGVSAASARSAATSTSVLYSIGEYALDAAIVVAGFSGYIITALLYNAGAILVGIGQFAQSVAAGAPQISTVSNQVPGVAPILPGLDIPFIPSIIALAVILIVHEFSHGVLSRIYKVKIKQIGILVFGSIPIGAFVEPDETKIKKLDSLKQTKIFSAGVSANFVFTLVFFVPFLLTLIYFVPSVYQTNVFITSVNSSYPAGVAGVPQHTQIVSWDGQNAVNLSNPETFESVALATDKPNSNIDLVTSNGTFDIKAVADPQNSSRGLIGVSILYVTNVKNTLLGQVEYNAYATFALLFMFNLLIGIVNFLPIPGFDGWRVYKSNIKSQKFVNALTILMSIALVINVIPLIAHYL